MRRILVCREYPPVPGGGIGTYAVHVARLLAETGDTVHLITEQWPGARRDRDEDVGGRLMIHRLPVERPGLVSGTRSDPRLPEGTARELFRAGGAAAAFAWQAAGRIEALVERDEIDLIEAPDYEAPLVAFQLRRAAGLGPARRPPCVLHLHSPTEFVSLANGADEQAAVADPTARFERISISRADALLCPSRSLAAAAAARFGLDAGRIAVIPYPVGSSAVLARTAETWRAGPVLYVGRLEVRKGIVEWLEAAARLAREDAALRFAFIGSDHLDAQLGGSGQVLARIPQAVRRQFTFHESRDRDQLAALLGEARLAVVPSRWDNFPYTCIEAMASGLPVVVTPVGGTAEMVDDGVTGWIAESCSPDALVRTVREALATGADALAATGARAATSIRRLCDPATVAAAHQALARATIARGAAIPGLPPALAASLTDGTGFEHWVAETWRRPVPRWHERAAMIAATVGRGLGRPGRSARQIARHLRWRMRGERA